METKKKYDDLGKILVNKLRDENFATYLEYKKYASEMTIDEYGKLARNPDYDSELQNIEDERFGFFKSLDKNQRGQLDKLILSVIDATAFNFLREIEERMLDDNGLGLIFDNKDIDPIYSKFLSGTFFGEYFLWIEKHSNYGNFQY